MANNNNLNDELKKARRKENQAHSDLDYYERQAEQQKNLLEEQQKHKDECIVRLIAAKENGLSPLLIRELQVLLAHIRSVVETASYKVDISQENFAKAEDTWNKEQDRYVMMKNSSEKLNKEESTTSQQSEKSVGMKLGNSLESSNTMASKIRRR